MNNCIKCFNGSLFCVFTEFLPHINFYRKNSAKPTFHKSDNLCAIAFHFSVFSHRHTQTHTHKKETHTHWEHPSRTNPPITKKKRFNTNLDIFLILLIYLKFALISNKVVKKSVWSHLKPSNIPPFTFFAS